AAEFGQALSCTTEVLYSTMHSAADEEGSFPPPPLHATRTWPRTTSANSCAQHLASGSSSIHNHLHAFQASSSERCNAMPSRNSSDSSSGMKSRGVMGKPQR